MSSSCFSKLSSSFAEFAEPRTAIGHGALLQRLISLALVGASNSKEVFHRLATALIRIAEHSIGLRDMETLAEVSEILLNLPVPEARQAGSYYCGLVMKRSGQVEQAQTALQRIADSPTGSYRARSMQTLGVIQQERGDLDQAGRLYFEAMRAGGRHDSITAISLRLTISAIKSVIGDHQAALVDLEGLLPLMRVTARHLPFFFYVYHADLAYELGQVGRTEEAEATCAIALASPFAPAYPEWRETRDEIAAKRLAGTPSVVAISRLPEKAPSPEVEPKPNREPSRPLASPWPAHPRDSFQRAIIPNTATAAIPHDGITQSILDRVLICIRSRAPPACL